ncbi:hypothetical protein VNO77_20190 [Canavalia gladiata]|uniref:Uncharacterized protein n=1 Tax=Canavalia gladiata TaxID=3824 RepID=A0AAN9LU10_CANGL
MALQQEIQNGALGNESKLLINVVDARRHQGLGRDSHGSWRGSFKVCTYFDKTGCTIKTCFKKHGYPPTSRFSNESGVNNTMIEKENETNDQVVEKASNPKFIIEKIKGILPLLKQNEYILDDTKPSSQVAPIISTTKLDTGTNLATISSSQIHDKLCILYSGAIDHITSTLYIFDTNIDIKVV